MAVALFEIPARSIGLLGLVPLVLGLRGLWRLRHPEGRDRVARRAVGSGAHRRRRWSPSAPAGDNLAVYIPLFRVGPASAADGGALLVFVARRGPASCSAARPDGHPPTVRHAR